MQYARNEFALTRILPYENRIVSENPYSRIFYVVNGKKHLHLKIETIRKRWKDFMKNLQNCRLA